MCPSAFSAAWRNARSDESAAPCCKQGGTGVLNHLRLLQTPLLRRLRLPERSRIPSGCTLNARVYPETEDFTAPKPPKPSQDRPKTPQDRPSSAQVRPSCLQVAILSAMLPASCSKMPPKWAEVGQDAILEPSREPPWVQKPRFSLCFCMFLGTSPFRFKIA